MLSEENGDINTSSHDEEKKKVVWSQWLVGFELFLLSNAMGYMIGWTASALPILTQSPTSSVKIDKNEASWIATSMDAGRTIGSIIGAIIASKFGTKTSLLWVGLIEVFGYSITVFFLTPFSVILSRLILGLSLGIFGVVGPIFIGEVSNPNFRGTVSGVRNVGMNFGQILGNVCGDKLELNQFSLIAITFIALFLLSFYWLPKSPYFFVINNKDKRALDAVKFYRPDVEDVTSELESLQNFIKRKKSLTLLDVIHDLFIVSHNRNGLFKIIVIVLLLQLSGQYTMAYYTGFILGKFDNSTFIITIITALSFFASIMGTLTNNKFNRKTLLAVSSLAIALSYTVLGSYYILLKINIFNDFILDCILIGSLIVRKLFLSYGVSIVLGTLLSEIFGPNVKFLAVCIVNIVSGMSSSISTKFYQPIYDAIGYGIYFIYAGGMFLLCIYTVFLPETRGKTLLEIQLMLEKKASK